MADTMYCMKCQDHKVGKTPPVRVVAKNGKPMLRGECETCGTKMTKFVK